MLYKVSAKRKARVLRKYGVGKRRALSTYSASWPRPSAGLPDTTLVKLRYVDQVTLTSALGAVAVNAFRMNSIFDPDFTGTGHQPLYHDSWAALYNRYVVTSSTIKCTFSVNDTTAANNWAVGIVSDDNASISTTITTNLESTNSPWEILTPSGGSKDRCTLSGVSYSPMARLGLSVNDDTVGAAFGTNPAAPWYAVPWGANIGATTSSTCNVVVTIEFVVRMKQLSTRTQS